MKIFEAIKAKRERQVAVMTRFARIEPEYELSNGSRPDHFQWKIGAEIFCRFTGPLEAKEHLTRQATRMIAKEVYGEIVDDLMALQLLLMEEQYRADGDPALAAIHNMRRKMCGESI